MSRAHGVVIRAPAPLDTFWDEARRFAVPADLELMNARIEYTDPSRGKLIADDVSFEPGARSDHLHVQTLHAFGTTFGDVHLWVSRPSTVFEIRLAREVEDSKAPKLNVARSPGEGVEWALDIPFFGMGEADWAENQRDLGRGRLRGYRITDRAGFASAQCACRFPLHGRQLASPKLA